jgi:tRNA (guanine26-N2/guanine27-N2)-dimethyltransferase
LDLVRTEEGRTKLLVPRGSLAPVPPTVPAFFNPAASTNRSVSVAVTEATSGATFCDALAGVGARGVRVATEVGRSMEVFMADVNGDAVRLAARNARLNRVGGRCEALHAEANSYLYSRYGRDERFEYVDVDPFGTPVPFVQGALRATRDGGIASFTATDTAVLCGVHPRVAERRYGAAPLNNRFHHETGLRVLLNAIRREAASLDMGVRPLAAHSTRHYMRVYVRVGVGPAKAEEARAHEGYVVWCPGCGEVRSEGTPERRCETCGGKAKAAGPLWAGGVTDGGDLEGALAAAERLGLAEAAKVLHSLVGVDGFPPWSFSVEEVCSELRIPSVSDAAVAERLRSRGWRAMRQPFEKTGLKTDAARGEVVEAVREAAGTGGAGRPA